MTTPIQADQRGGDIRSIPTLPTELWLQILEQVDPRDASHLWGTVRFVSSQFRDYVERHFVSNYLPDVTISLPLPRRDPTTGTLKWPGEPIPRARILFSFERITTNQQCAVLRSSESLGPFGETKTVDELRRGGALPEERLREAPPWVHIGKNHLTGVSVAVKGKFCWDEDRKIWTWEVNWRKLLTQFYRAKTLKRESTSARKQRAGR